jgi:cell division protein FtsN
VASYRNPQDAERQKAALALLGMEARVETVTIDGRETFYRVRLGPVKGLAAAEKMVAELNNNGIEALLVKVR